MLGTQYYYTIIIQDGIIAQFYYTIIIQDDIHCVFSDTSSNGLSKKRMYSCMIAFVWPFSCVCVSNVSLTHWDQNRHIHTGCICSTFLYGVFSNGCSNGLSERMHSHNGWICLTAMKYSKLTNELTPKHIFKVRFSQAIENLP